MRILLISLFVLLGMIIFNFWINSAYYAVHSKYTSQDEVPGVIIDHLDDVMIGFRNERFGDYFLQVDGSSSIDYKFSEEGEKSLDNIGGYKGSYFYTKSKNGVGRMNANIRKALEFAKADKLLVDDRFLLNVKLNSKKTPKQVEYKFLKSRADYDRVIDYLMIFMDYRQSVVDFVIYILFKCGLRPAEALCLRWENVDFEKQELFTNKRWNSIEHKIVPP